MTLPAKRFEKITHHNILVRTMAEGKVRFDTILDPPAHFLFVNITARDQIGDYRDKKVAAPAVVLLAPG